MAVHKCGVAHCPVSNMRLASGIAPVRKYLKAGVKVGLGVDGSASNDSSHMLDEVRQSMLLARLAQAAEQFTARQALRLATRGGAAVLGRSDIGELSAGKCADFFALDLNRIEFAGALHDPADGTDILQNRLRRLDFCRRCPGCQGTAAHRFRHGKTDRTAQPRCTQTCERINV
ncbi:hypothetical protein CHS0354_018556 [Potamilus streckersoni]|uniref:Amidohydrolase-related domain-containing protein n=1 Tax=Potamilus streckersoni TaxID=2493646 RepID=A0AAE0WB49_9BIVA|nr:hypothetical protein CHS0354_018556 [Potamilus streckersoni]